MDSAPLSCLRRRRLARVVQFPVALEPALHSSLPSPCPSPSAEWPSSQPPLPVLSSTASESPSNYPYRSQATPLRSSPCRCPPSVPAVVRIASTRPQLGTRSEERR